jgi:hypothetical protein
LLQPAQTSGGAGVVGVDLQHILQADLHIFLALHHPTEPQPRLLVALVRLDHLLQQAGSGGPVAPLGRLDALLQHCAYITVNRHNFAS